MKELTAPLAGEMSGHMFCGGDWYGFDDALFAAARLLHYVAELGGPLSRLLADLPTTVSTPELRVDCADDGKLALVGAIDPQFRGGHGGREVGEQARERAPELRHVVQQPRGGEQGV